MNNHTKLMISIGIDLLGYASYLMPFWGELLDVAFIGLEGWWIYHAYGSKKWTIIGITEELLPFTDFIPSCTLAHYFNVTRKNKMK
jgi:hypothetical protein